MAQPETILSQHELVFPETFRCMLTQYGPAHGLCAERQPFPRLQRIDARPRDKHRKSDQSDLLKSAIMHLKLKRVPDLSPKDASSHWICRTLCKLTLCGP